jgi:hypothetical protein
MPPRAFSIDARSSFRARDIHDGKKESVPRRSRVEDLQRLQETVKERDFYLARTTELEESLRASAPEALEEAMRLLLLELEDSKLQTKNLKTENEKMKSGKLAEELNLLGPLLPKVKALTRQYEGPGKEFDADRSALQKLIGAQSQVDSLANENKELRTELLQVEHSATEELSVMRSQLELLTEENEKLRTERDAERKEMSVIRPQLESLKENYGNLRAESSRRLASSTDELNVSRSKSKALGLDNDELRAEKGSTTHVRKLTDFLTCENENLFAELVTMESKLKEKETTIASLEADLESKLEKLHEVLVIHEALVQSLKEPKSKLSWGNQIIRSMTKTETLGGDGDIEATDLVVQTACTTSYPRTSSSKKSLSNKAQRMNVMVGHLEATYTGSLEDGLPSGFGSFRFKNGDTDIGTYIGEVKYGNMHGRGTLYHASGFSRGAFERNIFVQNIRPL